MPRPRLPLIPLILTTAALAVGCGQAPPRYPARLVTMTIGPVPAAAPVLDGRTRLNARTKLVGADRQLLATVDNLTQADVDHVVLKLYDGATLVATSPAIPSADLGADIEFQSLRAFTTYTVCAAAYGDAAETQLISTTDATSQASIAVTNETTVSVTVPCQLVDVAFSATSGASGVVVSPGGWASPAATETIVITTPAP